MIMKRRNLILALTTVAAAGLLAAPVQAQMDHSGHEMAEAGDGAASPAAQGYRKAMDVMHEAMANMEDTGDPDIDFVRGMIPHHQAAIDMAKVQLQYGTDAEIRALSEAIIAAQEKEIADMRAWLAARGVE
jgi:uncharacterized protein (DUF305 family)